MSDNAMAVLVDLLELEPIADTQYGHGARGSMCIFCGETDYNGPLRHSSNCVWKRAQDFIVQPQIDTVQFVNTNLERPTDLEECTALVLAMSGRAAPADEFDLVFQGREWSEAHLYRVRLDRIKSVIDRGRYPDIDRWDATILTHQGPV